MSTGRPSRLLARTPHCSLEKHDQGIDLTVGELTLRLSPETFDEVVGVLADGTIALLGLAERERGEPVRTASAA